MSGPIPGGLFGKCGMLKGFIVNVSGNELPGQFPPQIGSMCRSLIHLDTSRNQIAGAIPNFGGLVSLVALNLSWNRLQGAVPASLGSSSDQQGGNFENDAASPSWHPKTRVGGSIRKEVTVFTDIGVPLSFENVVRATGSFNASNCIGNGGFGATYKAEISPGVLVAIKRLSVGRFQEVQQFDAEIKTLGRLRHPNLVTLIGYHASETEMFLIYNYLPGGNLEKFIQERSTRAVDWRILHKIALDIALALAYLHDQCVPRVLHRDVKPSNILLDEDFNAYLSDFGLARLLGTSETHATTGVAGTFGYVAPEYAMTCRVSDKADVYSYGVVLLELISDKKALDPSFSSYGNGFNIVAWACMLLRQGRAKEFFTAGLWDAGPHDDLVEVLHLAVVCTVETLSTRPTMKQVVRRLKQLQPASC
ncbi:hypothetical protein AgCh_015214 [Apium graveolens]